MAAYTLESFCEDKLLPLDFVVDNFSVKDGEDTLHYKSDSPTGRWKKGDPFTVKGILFPYTNGDGTRQHRIRYAKTGKKRFCWGSDYKHQLLYGLNVPFSGDGKTIVVVEGESCTITGRLLGLSTVGVAGAPTGWVDEFKNLPIFRNVERILFVQERKRKDLKPEDIDAGAELCKKLADSFPGKVQSIRLDKLFGEDIKDLSDLWLEANNRDAIDAESEFAEMWVQAVAAARQPGMEWRDHFRAPCELEEGEVRQIIPGLLVEGINLTAAVAGMGKTWYQLSQARAVCTGEAFCGSFRVTERVKILYLIPEAGDRSLRTRMEKLRFPMDGEYCLVRTLKDGILRLDDPALAGAIKAGYLGVYLDTTVRFLNGADENDASELSGAMADELQKLRFIGALFICGAAHSRKSFNDLKPSGADYKEPCSLENAVRGSGDMGAMCDNVVALRHATGEDPEFLTESEGLTRLRIQNVKSRDFEPAEPFVIQGKPHIDEGCDFKVLEGDYTTVLNPYERATAIIAADQKISLSALCKKLGASRNHFETKKVKGWTYKSTSRTTGIWVSKSGDEPRTLDMPAF
jgi:hypothetical protein